MLNMLNLQHCESLVKAHLLTTNPLSQKYIGPHIPSGGSPIIPSTADQPQCKAFGIGIILLIDAFKQHS
jgi:hypothetical protein